MVKRFLYVLIVFAAIFGSELTAQKAPFKFGKVDPAEMAMTVYDLDTSAPAVILFDYGEFNPEMITYKRIVRIKILKKEGYKYVNRLYPGSEKTIVRGITYNMENGVIVEEKLKNESIFRERITEDYYRLRITMPNVKVGSVCDIEFSSMGFPWIWNFQDKIPVKWSEFWLPSRSFYDFRKNYFGYEPLFLVSDYHWVGKDMPAFKEEPYMNSINNYISKLEIDILRIHTTEFTTDWNAVARRLDESDYFGGVIGNPIFLNEIANEIKLKYNTDYEKVKAAYEAVKIVKWNEEESLFPNTTGLSIPYKDKIGNSAEINLILVNLLRKLDIETYPVIMSTRENGILSPVFPSLYKLNYVIAYAKINEKVYLLDATEELMPLGMIPLRCLNGQGHIINKEISSIVDLKPDKKDKCIELYDLDLLENNTLKGTFSTRRMDYSAFNVRKKIQSFNSREEYIEFLEDSLKGIKILDYKFENLDSIYLPLNESYSIEIKNQAYKAGDNIYLNPLLFNKLEENIFKNDTRRFPIDFGYCIEKNIIVKFKIPENYSVIETPSPISITLPDKSASMLFQVLSNNKIITLTYKFNINKIVFLNTEYLDIKEFYNQLIKKHAEPIILKAI